MVDMQFGSFKFMGRRLSKRTAICALVAEAGMYSGYLSTIHTTHQKSGPHNSLQRIYSVF